MRKTFILIILIFLVLMLSFSLSWLENSSSWYSNNIKRLGIGTYSEGTTTPVSPSTDCSYNCSVRDRCTCNVSGCSRGLFLLKNYERNPLSNNVIENINNISFNYTFQTYREGKVEVTMACDEPRKDEKKLIGITVPEDMKFYISGVSCNETYCAIDIDKNIVEEADVMVQLFEEPYGSIYYSGSASVSSRSTGDKDIPLTNFRSSDEGTELKVLAIASSSGQRVDRLKDNYVWGVSGGLRCDDGICDIGEDKWNCCVDCGVPFSGCEGNTRFWYTCDDNALTKHTYDCNSDDGCKSYQNGCEDMNYYCDAGECKYSSSNKNTDGCSGNNFLDYNCSVGCVYTSYDCSASGNWNKDSIQCNCVCGGYDVRESIANGNCRDGKDNDCDGFSGEDDCDCRPNCDATLECSFYPCEGRTYYCFYSNSGSYTWSTTDPKTTTETACNDGHDNNCEDTCDTDGCGGLPADSDCGSCMSGDSREGGNPKYCQQCDATGNWGNINEGLVCNDYSGQSASAGSNFCKDTTASSSKICDLSCESGSCSGKTNCLCEKNKCGAQCVVASDCTDTTRCDGKKYQTRTASCTDSCTCSYGDWTDGTCAQSASNCGAECDNNNDCTSGVCQADCTCGTSKPDGQPCTSSGECASGYCVDGVCCNSACNGRCERCDSYDGTAGDCHNIANGNDPSSECPYGSSSCIGNACNGVGDCQYKPSSDMCADPYQTDYGCPWGTSCGDDVGVRTNKRYCAGNGYTCTGTISSWSSWSIADYCTSTETCTDDDSTCNNNPSCGTPPPCKTKGQDCTSTACCTGLNCVNDRSSGKICCDPGQCSLSGTCYNNGYYSDSWLCVNEVWKECTSSLKCSEITVGSSKYYCDPVTIKWKAGDSNGVDCDVCKKCSDTGTCTVNYASGTDTTEPGQCKDGKTCNNGICSGTCIANCQTCTSDSDCCSGHCNSASVNKLCLPTNCNTLMNLIVSSFGTSCGQSGYNKIADVNKDGTVDISDLTAVSHQCNNDAWCDTALKNTNDPCIKPNGQPCTSYGECASGFCVDGVCCNSACDGTCKACDLTGSVGTCTNVPNDQDPDTECQSSSTNPCMGEYCNGNAACQYATASSQGLCSVCKYCGGNSYTCSNRPSGTDCGTCAACDSSGACIYDATQDIDCPLCKECSGINSCVPQAEQSDVKDECPADVCKYGYCNGAGACKMKSSTTDCDTCKLCDGSGSCNVNYGEQAEDTTDPGKCLKSNNKYCVGGNCISIPSTQTTCCFENSGRSCLTKNDCTARGGLYSQIFCSVSSDCPCKTDGELCSTDGECCSNSCIGGICMSSTTCPGECVDISSSNIVCISYCAKQNLQMKGCPTHSDCPGQCCCVCGGTYTGTTGLSNIPNVIREFFASIINIFTKTLKP